MIPSASGKAWADIARRRRGTARRLLQCFAVVFQTDDRGHLGRCAPARADAARDERAIVALGRPWRVGDKSFVWERVVDGWLERAPNRLAKAFLDAPS